MAEQKNITKDENNNQDSNPNITCPECQGSGTCTTKSSVSLSMDNAITLDSIINVDDKSSMGDPFCYNGKCSACSGKGKRLFAICRVCNGTGKCPICNGENICRICKGSGVSPKSKN